MSSPAITAVQRTEIAALCQQYKIAPLAKLTYPRRSSVINDADIDFIA